jgi:outer membrane biosynthesis protein TonB
MEHRRIIRKDIAASAIVHLTLVALILLVSEVHPFHAPPTDAVAVDIVTPEEMKEKVPEQPPAPQIQLPELSAKDKAEAPAPPPPPPQPAPQASPQPTQQVASPPQPSPQPSPTPVRREANAQPQQQPQPAPQAPSYTPPEPDVTVKYGVMLGLPAELTPPPKDGPKDNDGGGAAESEAAKLSSSVIAEFRRHLRTCAKLPASIAPSDNVHIKLRAVMTTDGQLARPPILIEASASAKGPILMQSAISALQACQPYTMLPADKYEEWKVLDLNFTPKDFNAS